MTGEVELKYLRIVWLNGNAARVSSGFLPDLPKAKGSSRVCASRRLSEKRKGGVTLFGTLKTSRAIWARYAYSVVPPKNGIGSAFVNQSKNLVDGDGCLENVHLLCLELELGAASQLITGYKSRHPEISECRAGSPNLASTVQATIMPRSF